MESLLAIVFAVAVVSISAVRLSSPPEPKVKSAVSMFKPILPPVMSKEEASAPALL